MPVQGLLDTSPHKARWGVRNLKLDSGKKACQKATFYTARQGLGASGSTAPGCNSSETKRTTTKEREGREEERDKREENKEREGRGNEARGGRGRGGRGGAGQEGSKRESGEDDSLNSTTLPLGGCSTARPELKFSESVRQMK